MARAGGITNAVNVGIAVQADWENREFISHISLNVRRLFEFLLQFEATTKSKLASLNEKLDTLERRLELLEVQVGTASANPSLFIECSVNQSGFIVQCQFYTMLWATPHLHFQVGKIIASLAAQYRTLCKKRLIMELSPGSEIRESGSDPSTSLLLPYTPGS
ncbi:hypothetical protein GOBAR_AA32213 [Gossypium barbadense]|uniref:Uncharacterized protein n=1 Tax=Gossypium barbadense TaxID=3634 RepID=A0A2P5WBM0_GOSBA|nr:hypothetical protein GOBAR_AA32213 [Gossypium barbadense]